MGKMPNCPYKIEKNGEMEEDEWYSEVCSIFMEGKMRPSDLTTTMSHMLIFKPTILRHRNLC